MVNLFFDLDGTLTDPKIGITGSYQRLMQERGVPAPSQEELQWVIGPPLRDCIPKLLNITNKEDIEEAVNRYRYFYVNQGGMYNDMPYDGVPEMLSALKAFGFKMYVATAKAHNYAKQILEYQGLMEHFLGVYGSELDGTRSFKGDLLRYLMNQEHISAKQTSIMIGDRSHDIQAAKHVGIRSIGITYGYGSKQELIDAGADQLCTKPSELFSVIQKLVS